jgi:hypothetical protein
MCENAFNKIERELRNEEGIANELDYVEQTSRLRHALLTGSGLRSKP